MESAKLQFICDLQFKVNASKGICIEMDPITLGAIIAGVIGVIAGIVQIIQYFEGRKEKSPKKHHRELSTPVQSSGSDLSSQTDLGDRDSQLKAVRILLLSSKVSDVWRGMEQVRQWLIKNIEDVETYRLLLDVVGDKSDLLPVIDDILFEMVKRGSKSAEETLRALPQNIIRLLVIADDEYYAANYDAAIRLYRRVLKIDPDNKEAKDHLTKAEIYKKGGSVRGDIPRVAEQYYRRARSYNSAGDVVAAMSLLNAAVESANSKGMSYPIAEEALENMENLIIAEEIGREAVSAIVGESWKDASDMYDKALSFDPYNSRFRIMSDILKGLLDANVLLDALKGKQFTRAERKEKLRQIYSSLEKAKLFNELTDTSLFNNIQKRYKKLRRVRTIR